MTYRHTTACLLAVIMSMPAFAAEDPATEAHRPRDFDEQQLRTLFTDKKQRDYFDALRAGRLNSEKKSEQVRLDGYVRRSDGSSVVWVNGRHTLRSNRVGDVLVHTHGVGHDKGVVVSSDGKRRRLKPGEIWHKQSGKVSDAHER